MFQQYAEQSKSLLPFAAPNSIFELPGRAGIGWGFWQMYNNWPVVLAAASLLTSPDDPLVRSPALSPTTTTGGERSLSHGVYLYSNTMIARPELWRPGALPEERLKAPVGLHEVLYPSRKVILWDAWPLYGWARTEPIPGTPGPMAFVDGHVAVLRTADASEPVQNPFWGTGGPERLMTTLDGARGVDYP